MCLESNPIKRFWCNNLSEVLLQSFNLKAWVMPTVALIISKKFYSMCLELNPITHFLCYLPYYGQTSFICFTYFALKLA